MGPRDPALRKGPAQGAEERRSSVGPRRRPSESGGIQAGGGVLPEGPRGQPRTLAGHPERGSRGILRSQGRGGRSEGAGRAQAPVPPGPQPRPHPGPDLGHSRGDVMARVLLYVFLLFLLLTVLRGLRIFWNAYFRGTQTKSFSRKGSTREAEMVRDPVCGTWIDR